MHCSRSNDRFLFLTLVKNELMEEEVLSATTLYIIIELRREGLSVLFPCYFLWYITELHASFIPHDYLFYHGRWTLYLLKNHNTLRYCFNTLHSLQWTVYFEAWSWQIADQGLVKLPTLDGEIARSLRFISRENISGHHRRNRGYSSVWTDCRYFGPRGIFSENFRTWTHWDVDRMLSLR